MTARLPYDTIRDVPLRVEGWSLVIGRGWSHPRGKRHLSSGGSRVDVMETSTDWPGDDRSGGAEQTRWGGYRSKLRRGRSQPSPRRLRAAFLIAAGPNSASACAQRAVSVRSACGGKVQAHPPNSGRPLATHRKVPRKAGSVRSACAPSVASAACTRAQIRRLARTAIRSHRTYQEGL